MIDIDYNNRTLQQLLEEGQNSGTIQVLYQDS